MWFHVNLSASMWFHSFIWFHVNLIGFFNHSEFKSVWSYLVAYVVITSQIAM